MHNTVPPTIYLFEDDADLRLLLIELLQSELHATVVACTSIAEVLSRAAGARPDLIVADFWGSSQLILSDAEREQIAALGAIAPTVLVSARQWALETGPEELGLAGVVQKPLDIDAFVTALRGMLPPIELADETATDLPPREALSVLVLPWGEGIPELPSP